MIMTMSEYDSDTVLFILILIGFALLMVLIVLRISYENEPGKDKEIPDERTIEKLLLTKVLTDDIYVQPQSIEEGLEKEIGEERITSNSNNDNHNNGDKKIHAEIVKNIKSFFNFNNVRKNNNCCKEFEFNETICPICLLDFKVGETIAYSDNDECNHYYHKECLIPWFMKGNMSCPNCRREFISFKKKRKSCMLCT